MVRIEYLQFLKSHFSHVERSRFFDNLFSSLFADSKAYAVVVYSRSCGTRVDLFYVTELKFAERFAIIAFDNGYDVDIHECMFRLIDSYER